MGSGRDLTGCPSDDHIASFLHGALPAAQEQSVLAHIATCPSCRAVVGAAATGSATPRGATGRAAPALVTVTKRSAEDDPVLVARPQRSNIPAIKRGDILVDKYRIEGVLGTGGMGTVYGAQHLQLDRKVAIKVMHPALLHDADAIKRFSREARAAASLQSMYAVRILDVDRLPSGLPFIVMEHLDGRDLARTVEEDGVLSIRRAITVTSEAAEALAEAHDRNIIHRDLKPHNLFLTSNEVVKVLDFGLAKTLHTAPSTSSLTQGNALIGSPSFMSPEQVRGTREIDARSDVWGLGATLFYLLAGVPPFVGPTVLVVGARILNDAPLALSDRRTDVPASLEHIVKRCLAKDRAQRYSNMLELRGELLRVLEEPLASEPRLAPTKKSRARSPEPVSRDPLATQEERDIVTAPRASGGSPDATDEMPPRTQPMGGHRRDVDE